MFYLFKRFSCFSFQKLFPLCLSVYVCCTLETNARQRHGKQLYSVLCPSWGTAHTSHAQSSARTHSHVMSIDYYARTHTHSHIHTHTLFLSFSIFVSERFLRNGRLCLFVVGNNLVDNGFFVNEIAATIQKTNGGILTNNSPLWPNLWLNTICAFCDNSRSRLIPPFSEMTGF